MGIEAGSLRARYTGGAVELSYDGGVTWNPIGGGVPAVGSVTMAMLADIATASVIGRVAGGTGVPKALSATELTTLINAATALLPGALPAALFAKLSALLPAARGADLANADATISPGTDNCSLYVVPASAPLSPTRAVTFNHAGLVAGLLQLVRIVRMDAGAGGLQIKNNAGTTLYTMVAGTIANKYPYMEIYHNGTAWALNTGGFVTDV